MMLDDAEAALASHSKSLASNSAGLRISASCIFVMHENDMNFSFQGAP